MKSIWKTDPFMLRLLPWALACWLGCGQPAPPVAAPPTPKKSAYEQVPYAHRADFDLYTHEIGIDPATLADTVFVLPLNSCEDCVMKLLGMLSHNCARPYTVIVSGKNERIDPGPYLKGCARPMVWDIENVLNTYRLEITGPAVLLKKGAQTDVIHLNTGNLPDIHTAFRWQ